MILIDPLKREFVDMQKQSSISVWPSYSDEEIAAAAAVIASNKVNYWTGQEARQFELDFTKWTGSAHAIALANGTLALDVALKTMGVGPGDEVIVTPRSFIASVSTVVNAGATPVFADVDPESGNISVAGISKAMTDKTKAIIAVHLAGWPCDMGAIMSLANDQNVRVIEDCAQAHGAKIDGRSVGTIGCVGAWSFCQDKIMTTGGEGGMVTTDDPALWSAMWSYKDHGKNFDAVYNRDHPPGFRWVHDSFGTNWRMLEVQAAIGRIQLTRMAEWTARRTLLAKRYALALAPFSGAVRVPEAPHYMTHAYYRQYAYVRSGGLRPGWSRDRIITELNAQGVPVLHGSCPEIYLEKAFDGTPWRPETRLSVARDLGETSLMFLTHPTMTDEEIENHATAIAKIMAEAAA